MIPLVTDVYSCFSPANCPPETDLLAIEEIGWHHIRHAMDPNHNLEAESFQREIVALGRHMQQKMQIGHGTGRCALLLTKRLLQQKDGCVKITKSACRALQSYLLVGWKTLAKTCLNVIQTWENLEWSFESPEDGCQGVTLVDFDSPHFQKRLREEVVWVNSQQCTRNAQLSETFSRALTRHISIKGREPSCTEGLTTEPQLLLPKQPSTFTPLALDLFFS